MIKYCPAIIFNKYEFQRYLEDNAIEFLQKIRIAEKELEKISGYQYSIHPRFTNIYGHEFSFGIYPNDKNDKFDINVWDYTGGTSIFSAEINKENLKAKLSELFFLCDKWSSGEMECSDCGKIIKYQENRNHRYFAGVYCEDCWEGKWKAIEAKENYE